MIDLDDRQTALYRYYDKSSNLLYVGISCDPKKRLSQHTTNLRAISEGGVDVLIWTDLIDKTDIEWFENRYKARKAEELSIEAERPRHNILHNKDLLAIVTRLELVNSHIKAFAKKHPDNIDNLLTDLDRCISGWKDKVSCD